MLSVTVRPKSRPASPMTKPTREAHDRQARLDVSRSRSLPYQACSDSTATCLRPGHRVVARAVIDRLRPFQTSPFWHACGTGQGWAYA